MNSRYIYFRNELFPFSKGRGRELRREEMKEEVGDTMAKGVASFEKQRRRNGRAIHNGTKLVWVIKLNSLQFKLSFVNFREMILKHRAARIIVIAPRKTKHPFSLFVRLTRFLYHSFFPINTRCSFTFVSVNRSRCYRRFFFSSLNHCNES